MARVCALSRPRRTSRHRSVKNDWFYVQIAAGPGPVQAHGARRGGWNFVVKLIATSSRCFEDDT